MMKDNAPANMNLIKNLVLLFMYYFFTLVNLL